MSYAKPIALALLIVGITVALPQHAVASCDSDSVAKTAEDQGWVKSDIPIYGLDKHGRLIQTSFNSPKIEVLEDHGFQYGSGFQISANQDYILYTGFSKDNTFENYLYDVQQHKDHKLPMLDHAIGIQFSPDSKSLSWGNTRQVFVMTLDKMKIISADLPADPETKRNYERGMNDGWSSDGIAIYEVMITSPKVDYYKFDVPTQKFIKINGYYDHDKHVHHFLENEKEAELYALPVPQWKRGYEELKSPDGDKTALVDNDYNLIIRDTKGTDTKIANGEYTNCDGITIRLLSWLGDGKYIAYRIKETTYVYGVDEHKKSILPNLSDVAYFWWPERDIHAP